MNARSHDRPTRHTDGAGPPDCTRPDRTRPPDGARSSDHTRSSDGARPSEGARAPSGRPGRAPRANPRRIAFEVLAAVHRDDAYANLLLPARLDQARLSAEDAALATALTYGTLRLQGRYDAILDLLVGERAVDAEVRILLRLGAHQLLDLATPAHAAVFETVAVARRVAPRGAGFVNAVLRKIAGRSLDAWLDRVAVSLDSARERLAAVESHPLWIVDALREALLADERPDELADLLAADNATPAPNLVVLPGSRSAAEPPAGLVPNRYARTGYTGSLEAVRRRPTEIRVQDEGSQLVALALVAARPVRPGERWLDLCAGPGGKAALLAALATTGGCDLIANEIAPARAALVRRTLAGFPDVVVTEHDGTTATDETFGVPGGFDRILVDAPCSGLGALRRRPESRWRREPADVAALALAQGALFDAAAGMLASGGILGYVTCSPHCAETRAVVAAGMARWPSLTSLPTADILRGITREPIDVRGSGESVQLWPHAHGTDAMFLALVTRSAGA